MIGLLAVTFWHSIDHKKPVFGEFVSSLMAFATIAGLLWWGGFWKGMPL
jgi:hypothetical protein